MSLARRLTVFQYGIRPSSSTPVPGFLIQTVGANGRDLTILVDTGFPRSAIVGEGDGDAKAWRVTEADYVVNRLASVGLAPGDIDIVVCTHLDPDHAGAHDQFPSAEFVVQRQHYAVARTSGEPRFGMPNAKWNAPGLRYRLIEGDTDLAPGVRLIESSGHVPWHQSVLVRLARTGPLLLAADAINFANQIDPDTRPIGAYDMDPAATRASTRKLVDLAAAEGARIIFGHDAGQWKTMRLAPDNYD